MDELIHCRVLGKSCLRVDVPDKDKDRYVYKMFTGNSIEGLLQSSERSEDASTYILYSTGGKKTLESVCKEGMLGYEEICNLVFFICRQQDKLKKYMLPASGLVLNERYIYTDLDSEEFSFVYLPISNRYTQDTLSDFFIETMSYDDEELVEIIYDAHSLRGEADWAEYLKQKLIVMGEKRRQKVLESAKSEIEKEEETMKPVLLEEKDNIKNAVYSCLIYLIVAGISVYLLLDAYILEYGEIATLSIGIVFLSLVTFGIIIRFFIPSLYKKIVKSKEKPTKKKDVAPAVEDNPSASIGWESKKPTASKEEYSKTVFMGAAKHQNILFGQGVNRTNINLDNLPITVGRKEGTADVVINSESISRLHARLFKSGDKIMVEDLNSTNGIVKNGIRLIPGEPVPLNFEDHLCMGDMEFVYG